MSFPHTRRPTGPGRGHLCRPEQRPGIGLEGTRHRHEDCEREVGASSLDFLNVAGFKPSEFRELLLRQAPGPPKPVDVAGHVSEPPPRRSRAHGRLPYSARLPSNTRYSSCCHDGPLELSTDFSCSSRNRIEYSQAAFRPKGGHMKNSASLAVVLLAACSWTCGADRTPPPPATPPSSLAGSARESGAVPTSGMERPQAGNPAAQNCIDKGGSIEMKISPGQEFGVCVFKDGSRCENWRFLSGHCAPGQCRTDTGICDQ